jgi:hypothetical protein
VEKEIKESYGSIDIQGLKSLAKNVRPPGEIQGMAQIFEWLKNMSGTNV